MPITNEPRAALERLQRGLSLWQYLIGRRAFWEQQGKPPPLRIETRLWRVTAYVLLLSGQLLRAGYKILPPHELFAFLAAGIHSALRGDPPRPFIELRYLGAGTTASPRDIFAEETAIAFVEMARRGDIALAEDQAIGEAAAAYGKHAVTIKRWKHRRSPSDDFLSDCEYEIANGYAGDLTQAARNVILQEGARYRARAARKGEAGLEKERRRKRK